MELQLTQSLIIAFVVGGASGAIGAFVVLRRMALVGDALSHVALPGIALALAYGVDPFWGVVVSLMLAAWVVFELEERTALPSEALVGILFTASLAIGILAIPDTEILEALFGEFPLLPPYFLFLIAGAALGIAVLTFLLAKKFAFRIVSPELAEAGKIPSRYNLLFLILFSVAVALGIKLVGTLLMGALTIIPASIARNVTKSMRAYLCLSAFLGVLISVSGVLVAYFFHVLPGPSIILFGIVMFVLSLFVKTAR